MERACLLLKSIFFFQFFVFCIDSESKSGVNETFWVNVVFIDDMNGVLQLRILQMVQIFDTAIKLLALKVSVSWWKSNCFLTPEKVMSHLVLCHSMSNWKGKVSIPMTLIAGCPRRRTRPTWFFIFKHLRKQPVTVSNHNRKY